VYDLVTKRKERVEALQGPAAPWQQVFSVDWAPDGSKLAITLTLARTQDTIWASWTAVYQVVIWDRRTGQASVLHSDLFSERQPRWAADSRSLIVLTRALEAGIEHPFGTKRYGKESRLVEYTVDGRLIRVLSPPGQYIPDGPFEGPWRAPDGRLFGLVVGSDGLTDSLARFGVGTPSEPVVRRMLNLTRCAIAGTRALMACVAETASEPPEVARIDLDSGIERRLTAFNDRFKNARPLVIEPLQVKNQHGFLTSNLLIKPVGYQQGQRYPLLIALYGFTNRFIADAQWIPNFPIRALAESGFAVLLANYPKYDASLPPPESAKFGIASNALASIEDAIAQVTALGVADPAQVGIMGFSYGAFLTQFALTHSRTFIAGIVLDGGTFSPLLYWMNEGRTFRTEYDVMFGGPPEGRSFDAWKDVAPALNVHALTAPILFEMHTPFDMMLPVHHLDFVIRASCAGAPIDAVAYFNAPHILTMPAQRLSSMQRNLDWFRFWLMHEEDADPVKREQYTRWRHLRDVQERRLKNGPPTTSFCQQ
jgi:dipeptidyl aminopeptidase/acylaminoacyl peptidase